MEVLIELVMFSGTPVGFLRWLIFKKKKLRDYLLDWEKNISILLVIGFLVVAIVYFYRNYII